MKTILFQGDSITDSGRNRDDIQNMGYGYPNLIASQLGFDYPDRYNFINKAVSGDRSIEVLARIKCDFIHQKPDICSILMGANDVWHEMGANNGIATPKFKKIYKMLVEELLESVPGIKLMLMEPYVTRGAATEARWNEFSTLEHEKAVATREIADEFSLVFVPLQSAFDEAYNRAPAEHWTYEGYHPTTAGHELIAREWLKAFGKIERI